MPDTNASLMARLRLATTARIGLGRAGAAIPTRAVLDFQMAHAKARDAVHCPMPEAELLDALPEGTRVVRSRAESRAAFLQRPDLGRRLDRASHDMLSGCGGEPCDLVIVVADGLSATAVARHGATVALGLRDQMRDWRIAPIVLAHQSRVALGDEIGECLHASACVILIGERPGLSADDSLGAYITWAPKVGRVDSERNCISNIRPPHGFSYGGAVEQLSCILHEAQRQQRTGVHLMKIQNSIEGL